MSRKHIFESLDEILDYYPFQDNIQIEDLLPTIKKVERTYLFSILDPDTWKLLLEEIDEVPDPETPWPELIDLTRQAAAHLIARKHMAKANVIFSAAGLLVAKTEGTVPASEFRTQELKQDLTNSAMGDLDLIIDHLEGNTAVFEAWASSEQRGKIADLIIRTAKEFSDAYPLGNNRYLFRMLLPDQRRVIRNQVTAELGAEVVQDYIEKIQADEPGEYAEIIERLHSAIALLTMHYAIPKIQQAWGPEGVAIFDSDFQRHSSRRSGDEGSRINLLRNTCWENGKAELSKLRKHFNKEASESKFAIYFNSEKYSPYKLGDRNRNIPGAHKPGYYAT